MQRFIIDKLINWKNSKDRKPLILKGVRQVGKTYILKDLRFDGTKIITDYTKRAKTDNSLKGIRSNRNFDLADKIIRNTYRTLLSRGQKGCYIYCEDKELLKYISKKLNKEIIM